MHGDEARFGVPVEQAAGIWAAERGGKRGERLGRGGLQRGQDGAGGQFVVAVAAGGGDEQGQGHQAQQGG